MADNNMEQQQQQQPDTTGDDENLADALEDVMSSLRLDVLSEVQSMVDSLRDEMRGGTDTDVDGKGVGEQSELEALRQQLFQAQKEADEERIENAFNAACSGAGVHRDLTLSYARANSEITVKNRTVYVDGKPVEKYVRGITNTPLGRHLSTAPAKGVDVQRSDTTVRNSGTSAELFGQIFGGS